ncbi:MAG: hypothetical protein K6E59_01120 [Bacilli bacterium]|nr:hypothetical protein [Bacilli bacterium]
MEKFYALKITLSDGDWGYYYACPPRLEKRCETGVREFDTIDEAQDFGSDLMWGQKFHGESVMKVSIVTCTRGF